MIFAAICLLNAARVGNPASSTGQVVQINDFIAQYAGARLAARGQISNVYDPRQVHALEREIAGDAGAPSLPALYPPFFYLVLMPLAALDMSDAYRLWAVITLGAAILAALCISPHWHTAVLGLIFPASAFCFAAGQNGNLSAALIGAGLLLLPRRPVAAGICFGLLAAYKPQLALAIPFCLVAGSHWRTATAMGTTIALTILMSLIAFGPDPIVGFVSSMTATTQDHFSDVSGHLWPRMPTVLAAMLQVTTDKTLAWTVQGLAAILALSGLTYVWRKCTGPTMRALALVAAIPLATPYYFDYDLAVFVIPLAFLVRDIQTRGLAREHCLLLAVLWVMPPAMTFAPATGQWPIAPIVWIVLLAHAALTTTRPSSIYPPAGQRA